MAGRVWIDSFLLRESLFKAQDLLFVAQAHAGRVWSDSFLSKESLFTAKAAQGPWQDVFGVIPSF